MEVPNDKQAPGDESTRPERMLTFGDVSEIRNLLKDLVDNGSDHPGDATPLDLLRKCEEHLAREGLTTMDRAYTILLMACAESSKQFPDLGVCQKFIGQAQPLIDELKDTMTKTGLYHPWVEIMQTLVEEHRNVYQKPEGDSERPKVLLQTRKEVIEEDSPS